MDAETHLLHTVPEAYSQLGIGRSTLYKLMGEGHIRFVKIGRKTLVPAATLEEYVASLVAGGGGRAGEPDGNAA